MCYYFVSPVEHKEETKSGRMVLEQFGENFWRDSKTWGFKMSDISLERSFTIVPNFVMVWKHIKKKQTNIYILFFINITDTNSTFVFFLPTQTPVILNF
jgi:hypothetical protein